MTGAMPAWLLNFHGLSRALRMSDFEPFDRESPHPEQLLDELESIKGVLDANDVFAIHNMPRDMALPDGTLSAAGNGSARLLNIEQIFEQEIPAQGLIPERGATLDSPWP